MKWKLLKRVLSYGRRSRSFFALGFVLNALAVGATLLVPILSGSAIDLMIGRGQVDFSLLWPILVKIALLVGVVAGCQYLAGLCNNRITFRTAEAIRNDAFAKLQHLPLSYLDAHPTGDLVSRLISDVDTLSDGLLMGLTQFFSGVLTIGGTIGFMFSVHWLIALAVVVLTPLSLVVASFIATRSYRLFSEQSKIRGMQTALIDEMVAGQKTVRAFGTEQQVQESFDRVNENLRSCSLKAVFLSSLTNPATRFVNSMVYACVCVVGALVVLSGGGVTVGGLSALLSYANQYTKPFNEISGVITELQSALASAERVMKLMDEMPESPDASGELENPEGRVSLEKVAFSYTPDKPLIENLSLQVQPGQRIAIVGPTGCGKTTLINLLMRFYDVLEGTIRVEGLPVTEIARGSLRRSFGMVLQDTWLKAGTIRENLCLGNPQATQEEMEAAARLSHAHSFIKRLPQQYDTVIGEDGGLLSAGQKQLLCITRVMLTHPPMLILDEATSSIDSRTEIQVQSAFEKLMKGRTSFVVAHRLSTIRTADKILVMNSGNVVEQGTHEELLALDGFYAKLYNSQFKPLQG